MSRIAPTVAALLALATGAAHGQATDASCTAVNGVADFHVHQFANLSFGGNIFHGKTYHPNGIEAALSDCGDPRDVCYPDDEVPLCYDACTLAGGVCEAVCEGLDGACYGACDAMHDTCDVGCDGLSAGCAVPCGLDSGGDACQSCRSEVRNCRDACDDARSDCRGVCDADCDDCEDDCRDDCDSLTCQGGPHGPKGVFDIVGAAADEKVPHKVEGYPDFNDWPKYTTKTHQQAYYTWVKRAHEGGLKLIVNLAGNNEGLCETLGPAPGFECDDMWVLRTFIQAAKDLEDAIDLEDDGQDNDTGWYRIAYSPGHAREIINDGAMAVVLGAEVPTLFDCYLVHSCTEESLRADIQEYKDLGLRHIFPIHGLMNAFGGSAVFEDAYNTGNFSKYNETIPVRECSQEDWDYKFGFISEGLSALITVLEGITGQNFGSVEDYDNFDATCNQEGLTALGDTLINALMDAGMIIDIDHMSILMRDDVLTIAEARGYGGIVAGHAGFAELTANEPHAERQLTASEISRISALGGAVAPIQRTHKSSSLDDVAQWDRGGDVTKNQVTYDCLNSAQTFAQHYLYAVDHMDGRGVGLGSDWNGFGGQPAPRFGDEACGVGGLAPAGTRVTYPFALHDSIGGTMGKFTAGNKTFDINTDGLATIGMLPDFVAELRAVGLSDRDLDPLFDSAETYIEAWEAGENVLPTIRLPSLGQAGGSFEGDEYDVEPASFTDPDCDEGAWTVRVERNDGFVTEEIYDAPGDIPLGRIVLPNNGNFTIDITVTDSSGVATTKRGTINVNNRPPVIDTDVELYAEQGVPFRPVVSFTDVPADGHQAWFVYDGAAILALVDQDADTAALEDGIVFDARGVYDFELCVGDGDSPEQCADFQVTVASALPVVEFEDMHPNTTTEGSVFAAQATFRDPDFPGGIPEGLHTAFIDWGDGSSEPAILSLVPDLTTNDGRPMGRIDGTHRYASHGTYRVKVCADDGDVIGCGAFDVVVANAPPAIDSFEVDPRDERFASTVVAGIHEPGALTDVYTATIDWGEGDGEQPAQFDQVLPPGPPARHLIGLRASVSVGHRYAQSGEYTVRFRVSDGVATTLAEETITVANRAPTLVTGGARAIDEGGSINLDGASYADVAAGDTHTAQIRWAEGEAFEDIVAANGGFVASRTYDDDGTFTARLCVSDETDTTCDDFNVDVVNVAPTFDAGSDVFQVFLEPEPFDRTITFADPGSDEWSGTVDYGDGTVEPLVINAANRRFTISHMFEEEGPFTVAITLSDGDGGITQDSFRFERFPDSDGDRISDGEDNCVELVNPSQSDCNGDGEGDACERSEVFQFDCALGGPNAPYDVQWFDPGGEECETLWNGQLEEAGDGLRVTGPGLEGFYVRVDTGGGSDIDQVRFISSWHDSKPTSFTVWYTNHADRFPGSGANIAGTFEVDPARGIDDGRSATNGVHELQFPSARGRFWFIELHGTINGDFRLFELELAEGDVGEFDTDGDGRCDNNDTCFFDVNGDHRDDDGDGFGNVCDPDDDGDGVPDGDDIARRNPNRCRDADGDGCDDCVNGTADPANDGVDSDGDGVCDENDPLIDSDGDLVADADDNCVTVPNPEQGDCNLDGEGDACERTQPLQVDCAIGGPNAPYDVNWRDLDGVECASLWNGNLDHTFDGLDVRRQDVAGLYVRVDLSEPEYVDSVRYITAWYLAKPGDFTIWRSDDPSAVPGAGAIEVAAFSVDQTLGLDDGSPRTNGRHEYAFPGAVAQYWFFEIQSTFNGNFRLFELEFGAGDVGDTDLDTDGLCDPDDNCHLDGNADQLDSDGDGFGDTCDDDDDGDGVVDAADAESLEFRVCRDADGDTCDDCASGSVDPANDGQDTDGDGQCNAGDPDDDNDGVADASDPNPVNPRYCGDSDGDACDDCSQSANDDFGPEPNNFPNADGPDHDGDGVCNLTDADDDADGVPDVDDPAPLQPNICGDADGDGCDDCSATPADDFAPGSNVAPADDGTDTDSDGQCDAGDPDDDNDGVLDGRDPQPLDPSKCGDVDRDTCNDCWATAADDFAPGSNVDTANDGADRDSDGICNPTDPDDDNDGVPDVDDPLSLHAHVCGDSDGDHCDDCSATAVGDYAPGSNVEPNNDGLDTDGDGACDRGDTDDDNDGVLDGADTDRLDAARCADVDGDGCDDCTNANQAPENDGSDVDGDGLCDAGDPDDDNDGVLDADDADPHHPRLCEDADADGCDDCSQNAPGNFSAEPKNDPLDDGPDADGDGACNAGDLDDDNDGVLDVDDRSPQNPRRCRDADADGCDDCWVLGLAGGQNNFAPGDKFDVNNDGVDTDGDGICNNGDDDDDGDGVLDDNDSAPLDAAVCADADGDGCDDCAVGAVGAADPANDGVDTDGDGVCDAGDLDDDNDTVPDAADGDPLDASACADVDADGCDDCAGGQGPRPGADGPDADGDGFCDTGDPCPNDAGNEDGDADGVCGAADNCPLTANADQGDADGDGAGDACDACALDPRDDVDGDDICGDLDNCPTVANPGQVDANADGFGDACVSLDLERKDAVTIGRGAVIGEGVELDIFVRIGADVVIGDNVVIMAEAEIGDGVHIGDGAIVAPHTALGDGVALGSNALVYTGAEMGAGASLGELSSVGVRAAVGAGTQIGDGATVFHFAQVGSDCELAAGAYIGTSVVGDRCRLGVGAYIGHRGRIGDDLDLADAAQVWDGVQLGDGVIAGPDAQIRNDVTVVGDLVLGEDTVLGGGSVVGSGVTVGDRVAITDALSLGDEVFVGDDAVLFPGGQFGARTHLGARCATGAVSVGVDNTFGDDCQIWGGVTVGDDNTVGHRVLLLPGAHLGDRTRVADDSVVSDAVPDDAVVLARDN